MGSFTCKINRPLLIFFALLLFAVIALVLRLIPLLFIQNQGFHLTFDPDTWYTMRQIEVMVAHFPHYNWFDPMTAYPLGKTIDWGPFYPFLASILGLALGASSRTDIIYSAGWISPIMTAIMVPITYKLGARIWDWKAGIVSAGFISVLSYQYFIQSTYGLIDHHIAEIFFITLFFLAYLYALEITRQNSVDLKNAKTLIVPTLLAGLSGAVYFLGYISSPTVILALLIVGIYTFIQYIVDYTSGKQSAYLLFVNVLSFSIIAILVTLFGFHQEGLSLIVYSQGHVYVMLGLITETVLFYCLTRIFHKNRGYYFLSLAGIVIGGYIFIQTIPAFQALRDQATSLIWGYSAYSFSVLETQPWTFSAAYEVFNLALFLMVGGLAILIWNSARKRQNEHLFLLIWFAVMLVLTLPHQRFQLYLTVPVALLAGICISESIRWSWDTTGTSISLWISRFSGHYVVGNASGDTSKKERKAKKTTRGSDATATPHTIIKGITLVGVTALAIVVFATSAVQDISYVAATPDHEITQDWIEALEWLRTSTPSPGVDYFQDYDQQTFTYPNSSYGVMAPWSEGHAITFFSKRIPITNPFQNNLEGNNGAAAFFISGNEDSADAILTAFKGRYVITDLRRATDTFPTLIPWVDNSGDISPYLTWFFIKDPANPSGLTKTHLLRDAYFQTLLVRLQMFDGSLVIPATAEYTQYMIQQVPDSGETAYQNGQARVILNRQTINMSDSAGLVMVPEEKNLVTGMKYAGLFSSLPYQPIEKVPALTHYRLVHESSNNISVVMGSGYETLPDIKSVKIFEYVNGARIPGEGTIELSVITNTGRTFVYRQESDTGEFIVPYATDGGTHDVKANGLYHIVGTTRYIAVTEDDVLNGNTVTGSV